MSSSMEFSLLLLFASFFFLQGTLGEIICEYLPTDICSYSIASSGKRCLLENFENRKGKMEYQCRTSEVIVEHISEHIETDECVRSCGVDRNSVGISSDTLLEAESMASLCSPPCYQNCPNIIDLYFNLAVAEGFFLPDLCENQRRSDPHGAMVGLLSFSGAMGPAPAESMDIFSGAPAPSFSY